jgi:hypothetical protein
MQTTSKNISTVVLALLLALIVTKPVLAQDAESLQLGLARNFGYSSGTGEIQGNFTLKATGPETLARVVFFINDEVIGEVSQAPFELQFHTGSYPEGVYMLSAIGYTTDGRELRSNEQKREFVSAQEGWQTAGKIILPILGVVVLSMLISFVIPILSGKKSQVPLGATRGYGLLGGTICPKCGRPFGVHVWGLNLVVGKLDRCPHCGKWSLVQRYPPAALRQAELAELENVEEGDTVAPRSAERLEHDLDDSRYQDM